MRVRWMLIHKIAYWIGYVLAFPFMWMGTWIPKEKDVADFWSFAHALAAALLAWFFYIWLGSRFWGFFTGFLVMYAYELVIDTHRLEDPRGASPADIGYDFIGAFLAILVTLWK